jgi:hypothetical protein
MIGSNKKNFTKAHLFSNLNRKKNPGEEPRTSKPETVAITKKLLEKHLNALQRSLKVEIGYKTDAHIILGCEDFFNGISLAKNACLDVETVYQMLSPDGPFANFSKAHPNCIICPGSMYLSEEIPEEHNAVKYDQNGATNIPLATTTCYVTNIMPVFYQGKLVRLIRKGELVKFNKQYVKDVNDIKPSLFEKNKLRVISYHEDELESSIKDEENGKKSVCYLGKTLLPSEKKIMQEQLGVDLNQMAFTGDNLFSHEYMLGDERFLFLICGECNDGAGEYVSTTKTLLENNNYHYIIHSTAGVNVPPSYLEKSIYIHADSAKLNEVKADGKELVTTAEILDKKNNTRRFDYWLPLSNKL